jgi:hypothetical protein
MRFMIHPATTDLREISLCGGFATLQARPFPALAVENIYGQSFAFELSFRIPNLLQPVVDFEAARRRPREMLPKRNVWALWKEVVN